MTASKPHCLPKARLLRPSHWGLGLPHRHFRRMQHPVHIAGESKESRLKFSYLEEASGALHW